MNLVTFANALKLDTQGNIVLFDDNPAEQTKLLNRLKQNRLFKLLNLVQTRYSQGDSKPSAI